jgi:hypothetical protein
LNKDHAVDMDVEVNEAKADLSVLLQARNSIVSSEHVPAKPIEGRVG